MPRNQWLASVGITGWFASECPAGIRRNTQQETAIQTLDGQQDVLPAGFAEGENFKLGVRLTMPLERVKLMLAGGEIARLIREGKMRKL